MGIIIRALCVAEFAIPVKAVLNNLGENPPKDISIWGVTKVQWSDGTVTDGVKHCGCVYYIEGAGRKILVDTGVGDFDEIRRIRNQRGDRFYLKDSKEWDLVGQLNNLGVNPDEIEIVINTHLHWDHVGGNRFFRNARFYAQSADVPLALTAPEYAPHFFPERAHCISDVADRLVALDGDAEIVNGVEVWKVGGHTPGSQVVAVRTDKGVAVLAGDVICKYDNWNYDWPGPAGNIWDLGELARAHAALRRKADIIVPGHDWRFWELHPGGIVG